jgi:hypothetical protein
MPEPEGISWGSMSQGMPDIKMICFDVAANVDFGNLRVYQYDGAGNQVASLSRDKEVWLFTMGLACIDKKALLVFQTHPRSTGQGDEVSRIKIMALDLQ